jgi:hypothetical protein
VIPEEPVMIKAEPPIAKCLVAVGWIAAHSTSNIPPSTFGLEGTEEVECALSLYYLDSTVVSVMLVSQRLAQALRWRICQGQYRRHVA